MDNNKLDTITNLFEDKEIRSIWDSEKEEYFFSVVDIVSALTDSNDPAHYWRTLKSRMIQEGNQTVTNCDAFKLKAKDGKMRNTDMLNTQNILRLIESIPSPKAEPFKMWLAGLGNERINEVFDPELTINRAVNYYCNKSYSDECIKKRLTGIVDRFKITDIWKDGGVEKTIEYVMLTNEIYKDWSGMKASEYKKLKDLRKESLRDNMTDIEVLLTDLGEIATRDIAQSEHPQGFNENMNVAKRGGKVANEIKCSQDVYKFMTNNIEYGWIDINENIHLNTMKEFRKIYRTMSIDEILKYKIGTCIEQVNLMHYLLDKINVKNKMYCCRIFEPDDYGNLEEEEHMHCFVLYYENNKVYHMEHPDFERKGIYEYNSEEDAIKAIVDYYIKLRGGKDSPTKEFYEVPVGVSFKEFNKYINHV